MTPRRHDRREPDEGAKQKTPKGYPIPKRPRKDVMRDFRKVVAPQRDQGRKPA